MSFEVIDVDSWEPIPARLKKPSFIDLSDVDVPIDLTLDDSPKIKRTSVSQPQMMAAGPSRQANVSQSSSLAAVINLRSPEKRQIVFGTKEGPPMKKRRTTEPIVQPRPTLVPSRPYSQERKRGSHVLCDDSAAEMERVFKKVKVEVEEEEEVEEEVGEEEEEGVGEEVEVEGPEQYDSEEEYQSANIGLDLLDPSRWKPLEPHDDVDVNSLEDRMSFLDIDTPPPRPRWRPLNITNGVDGPRPSSDTLDGDYVWNWLRKSKSIPNPRPWRMRLPGDTRGPSSRRALEAELQLRLQPDDVFLSASGAINKIAQRHNTVAICGAALGGHRDVEDEGPNAYNGSGSFLIYHNGQVHPADGHEQMRPDNRDTGSRMFRKYYTVNDVKFDPKCNTRVVTSANDRTVKIWTTMADDDDGHHDEDFIQLEYTFSYPDVPQDLSFKPEEAIVAVACQDGKIYIHTDVESPEKHVLTVAPAGLSQATGAMVWGTQSSSGFIFASSEPHDSSHYIGLHKAFDLSRGKATYKFDACEAGDAIALHPDGDSLAIFTRGEAATHPFRIYDVRRKQGIAVLSTTLAPFPQNTEGEVSCGVYSPDGILLAVARNDNSAHVYDARMLGGRRGPVLEFRHTGPGLTSPGGESFGVVEAQWLLSRTRRLGLVTGGEDGCVRLWDVGKAAADPLNGVILAQVPCDIGYFSLGDVFEHEKALVVGDSAGRVSVFDTQGGAPLW